MEGQVLGAAAAVWKRAKRHTALLHEAGYLLLGLVSLATVTGLYFWLDVPLVAAAFTCLVVLVLLSLVSNLSSLIVLSFIGVCCLSYFFSPPIYSFRVDYAQDLITISAFVITSFVVNFLVTRVRDANQRLEVTNKALRIENVERKRAEQAQRESEDKLRQIIETGLGSEGKKAEVQPGFKAQVQAILNVIPAHTWYASPSGGLTFVNKRTADYLGLPKDHPLRFGIDVGARWDAHLPFVHPDDRAETQENWSTRLRTGGGGEGSFRVRDAHGGYRWFLSRAEPLRASDGTILQWVGVNLDIEDLKCAEQALRESERSARSAIDGIAGLVAIMAPNGEVETVNRQCLEYFGRSLQEQKNWEITDMVHPEDLPHMLELFKKAIASEIPYHFEQRLRRFDGEYRWFDTRGGAVRDDTGRVARWYVLLTDIEDRKRALARLELMQSDFAHMNRVATMGQLTASITHEVNQPITAAITYALAARRFLNAEPPNFHEVDEALSLIVEQGNRAGEVVERVRALIKKVPARKDAVAIDDAILEVIALTRTEAANNGVSVRTQFAEGLPRVQGDRVQLQQVMLNLIVNAIQAMSGIGEGARELQISIEAVPSEGGVRVGVRDTGPGLSPESLSRLFEPFYTTKPKGMGMGLSICRSIIEAHGGRLWAIPCEPQGTLFQFTIPAN
ncbi:PAS domain S-box-containing protein [Bradyrhizobium erythrophlei]|nr:PAS domain S-box-containing protein [Bradyrhizobium erythrophlei]